MSSSQNNSVNKHLVIVCTANICRSPMVEGLIRDRLQQEELDGRVQVTSAGVFGLKGEQASRSGVELLAARGIDISNHVASYLDDERLQTAALILVMEGRHRDAIVARAPEFGDKVILFSELIGEQADLSDPYRRGHAAYERALTRMDFVLDEGWARLLSQIDIGA